MTQRKSVNAILQIFDVGHSGFKSHLPTTFLHFLFTRFKSRLGLGLASYGSFRVNIT